MSMCRLVYVKFLSWSEEGKRSIAIKVLNNSLTDLNQSTAALQALKTTGDLLLTITAHNFMNVSVENP